MLNVGYQVDIAHDWDLEDILALVGDHGEYKAVVKNEASINKKWM